MKRYKRPKIKVINQAQKTWKEKLSTAGSWIFKLLPTIVAAGYCSVAKIFGADTKSLMNDVALPLLSIQGLLFAIGLPLDKMEKAEARRKNQENEKEM